MATGIAAGKLKEYKINWRTAKNVAFLNSILDTRTHGGRPGPAPGPVVVVDGHIVRGIVAVGSGLPAEDVQKFGGSLIDTQTRVVAYVLGEFTRGDLREWRAEAIYVCMM